MITIKFDGVAKKDFDEVSEFMESDEIRPWSDSQCHERCWAHYDGSESCGAIRIDISARTLKEENEILKKIMEIVTRES